jgi:hypothetical protein
MRRRERIMKPYKCKKGDVIAIERLHYYHSIGKSRREWRDWALGRAHKVSKKGIVKEFTLGGMPFPVKDGIRIATIADQEQRDAAAKVLRRLGWYGFEDVEVLKAAIREEQGKLTNA